MASSSTSTTTTTTTTGDHQPQQGGQGDVDVQWLKDLADWRPTIPDEVVDSILARTGFVCPDRRVKRLITLAAERFVVEVALDAAYSSKQKAPGTGRPGRPSKSAAGSSSFSSDSLSLTLDDLSAALQERGVFMRKPEYWTADK